MKPAIFESAEQYYAFRLSWKAAVKHSRSKSTLATHDEFVFDSVAGKCTKTKDSGQHKVPGWVTASHHLLFNILRGRDIHTGFTPITNPNKIVSNSNNPDHAFGYAKNNVYTICVSAQRHVGKREESVWVKKNSPDDIQLFKNKRQKQLEEFLEPFGGTVTIEHLANVDTATLVMEK